MNWIKFDDFMWRTWNLKFVRTFGSSGECWCWFHVCCWCCCGWPPSPLTSGGEVKLRVLFFEGGGRGGGQVVTLWLNNLQGYSHRSTSRLLSIVPEKSDELTTLAGDLNTSPQRWDLWRNGRSFKKKKKKCLNFGEKTIWNKSAPPLVPRRCRVTPPQ